MPLNAKDTKIYRKDDKARGKMMTAEERLKLLEVRLYQTRSISATIPADASR